MLRHCAGISLLHLRACAQKNAASATGVVRAQP